MKVERGFVVYKVQPKQDLACWLAREKELNVAEDETILATWNAIRARGGAAPDQGSRG